MKKHRKLKIALIVIVLIGVFVSAVGGLMIGSLLTKHDIQKIADYMYSIQCGNYNYAIAEKMMGAAPDATDSDDAVRYPVAGRDVIPAESLSKDARRKDGRSRNGGT